MKANEREKAVKGLLNTSVSDAESSLVHYSDPALLCDLLLASHKRGDKTREQIVRRRISKLIKKPTGGRRDFDY